MGPFLPGASASKASKAAGDGCLASFVSLGSRSEAFNMENLASVAGCQDLHWYLVCVCVCYFSLGGGVASVALA